MGDDAAEAAEDGEASRECCRPPAKDADNSVLELARTRCLVAFIACVTFTIVVFLAFRATHTRCLLASLALTPTTPGV